MKYFSALKQYREINYDIINPFSSLQIHIIIYTLVFAEKGVLPLGKIVKFYFSINQGKPSLYSFIAFLISIGESENCSDCSFNEFVSKILLKHTIVNEICPVHKIMA